MQLHWKSSHFRKRAIAQVIDLLVVYGLAMVSLVSCVAAYGYWRYSGDPALVKDLFAGESIHRFAQVAHVFLYFSYFTIAHWYFGRTVGKWAMGLEVRTATGADLGFLHSLGRSLAYAVSGSLMLGLGFLLPLFRNDGKALHDLLAETEVRPTKPAREGGASADLAA